MSELLPGLPRTPHTPARLRDAAAVVLYREAGLGVEVLWLRRDQQLAYAGGFYAFPGGRVDPADALVQVVGAQGEASAWVAAAARELFEETGVLVAQGGEPLRPEDLALARRALLKKEVGFGALLERHGRFLHAQDFLPAGRWLTPPAMPIRFDARFFLVQAPPMARAEIWPGELASLDWVTPAEALGMWKEGKALLHPPGLHVLQVMERFTSPEEAVIRLQNPDHCPGHVASRIEFQKGVLLFPLETQTLPPATHTNAFVLGNGELLIVDPGASEVRQYARLLALVAGLRAEGRMPKAVFLTHHHSDHIGGALAVKERLKVPLWCHARTADRLPAGAADRLLEDGEVIELQGTPAMRWRVLHTPGHARGHLCLHHEASGAAVVGDMVSAMGTIVIDPPEGDMVDYLASIERLKALPVTTLYPAHGPALPEGTAKLDEYLRHRAYRERLVHEALSPQGSTLKQVVAHAYQDTQAFLHPLAERSAQAVLIKLVREGRATRQDDRYFPAGN